MLGCWQQASSFWLMAITSLITHTAGDPALLSGPSHLSALCGYVVYLCLVTCGHSLQISPVWYQLRMDEADGSFKLTGGHDVDQSWIAKLREPLTQV